MQQKNSEKLFLKKIGILTYWGITGLWRPNIVFYVIRLKWTKKMAFMENRLKMPKDGFIKTGRKPSKAVRYGEY